MNTDVTNGVALSSSTDLLTSEQLDAFFWPASRAGVMSAWWGHVPFAHWLVAALRPAMIVELGTHNGVSFAAFCEAVHREKIPARCFAVDTWQGDVHAGLYDEKIYADLAHFTTLHYGAFAQLIRATFDDAQPYFADGSIDLLHIDGLHTYDAVKHDFENWLPKMSPAGVVLFHDTNVRERDFGVWQLWEELRGRFPSFEFSHAHGLGVLAVGAVVPKAVLELCRIASSNDEVFHCLRDRFSQLGSRLVEADMARRYAEHAGQLEIANGHLRATIERMALIPQENPNEILRIAREEIEQIKNSRDQALCSSDEVRLALEEARQSQGEAQLACDEAVQNSKQAEFDLSVALGEMQQLKVKLTSLKLEMEALATQYDFLKSENQAMKIQVSSLESENESLQAGYQQTLRSIYKSTSWRVTRPMRALQPRGLLRKLKSVLPVGRMQTGPAGFIPDSDFFDEGFYAGSAEARRLGKAPLQHYLEIGEAAGFAPSDAFDPVYYRQRNPDAASFTGGLLKHYLEHGRAEGRIARSPAQDLVLSKQRFDSARPCMVIAVHEATRTGAAILSWNLVLEFAKTYNVVTLLRRGGPIESQFKEASCASIVLPEIIYGHSVELNILAERVLTVYAPKFVVANSVETRNFVPAFEKVGVPCVALVHEFSGSVRPLGVLNELFEVASSVVFSAHIVADSAMRDYGSLAARNYQVIPQGASILPLEDNVASVELDMGGVQARLRSLQRDLSSIDPAAFVVTGLGTITSRKGVEFFIAAADSARRRGTRRKMVFAWVGKCYSFDEPYFDTLIEQIERSGLGDFFVFLGEFADLSPVYERADACLLSSRLDPLPNIAIDAALAGVPVVCFDQGSGFAEILNESATTRGLVVPYLDAAAAATVLCNLAEDAGFLAEAQRAMREMARARFDMPGYASRIERLGLAARSAIELSQRDHATLLAQGKFNVELYRNDLDDTRPAAYWIAHYLNASRLAVPRGRARTDWLVRRPLEGFHPLVYAEEAKGFDEMRDSDPLVHFLQSGCPDGRWKHRVIAPSSPLPAAAARLKVAIHAHFHYPELCGDFLKKVLSNKTRVALYITTTTEEKANMVRRACDAVGCKDAHVLVVVNRGRDIGPMLTGLPGEVYEHFDVVGHFHGKRSPHVEQSIGERWREFLWQHLIGDSYPMMDHVMQAFVADPALGLVFAEDPHLNGWDKNAAHAQALADRMGLQVPLPAQFDFPQGTMFWIRPAALKPVLDLELSWADFPEEPLPIDGTMLHALERLLPFSAAKAGFAYATTYLKKHRR